MRLPLIRGHICSSFDRSVGLSVTQMLEMRKTTNFGLLLSFRHLSYIPTFIFLHLFIHLVVRSFVQSFIHSVVCSSSRLFMHPVDYSFSQSSFIQWVIHSFSWLYIQSFIRSFIHSFCHSSIHSVIHLVVHSFIRLVVHLFGRSFIPSFISFIIQNLFAYI